MSLVLAPPDLSRYEKVVEIVLAPLEYPSISAWADATLRAICTLFRADGGAFFIPTARGVARVYHGLDPEKESSFGEIALSGGPGASRSYGLVHAELHPIASVRVEGGSAQRAELMADSVFEHTPCSRKQLGRAARALHRTVMRVPLLHGQAILVLMHHCREEDVFEDDVLELCRLVLPSLTAGLRTLVDQESRQTSLQNAFERLPVAVRITDLAGIELYRNQTLEHLLARDPERESVTAALSSWARRYGAVPRPDSTSSGHTVTGPPRDEIRTATGLYDIQASVMAAGVFDRGPSLLVTVQSEQGVLPTAAELQARHRLTPREAEVAQLLACGASNRQIAERLKISRHTARHHAQHVLEKTGVHTRKELLHRLLRGAHIHRDRSPDAA